MSDWFPTIFWFPTNYKETINQLAFLNLENKLDQKTIDYVLKRICDVFHIKDSTSVSVDIINKTLELARVQM